MDIVTQVQWVNSIKEHYGNSVEAVMESHVQSHQAHSTQVALNTQMFGLISEYPDYLTEFANAGGNVEYLEYLTNTFINVRSKVLGL